MDLFDYCEGPGAKGCEFVYDRSDDRIIGHCPTCRVVIEEMDDDELSA